MLWVGIHEPTEKLVNLVEAINTNLKPLGFPVEKRKFTPHLTLGRVKESQGIKPVVNRLQSIEFNAGEFEAREIVIMKSQLKPTGAEYTPLRRITLESN